MSLTLNEAKEIEVFFIEDETIKTINLYEKMCESIDETTTPRGVAPRLFLETETIEIDPDDFDDDDDLESAFVVEIGLEKTSKEDFDLSPIGIYELEYHVISTWGFTGNRYQSGKDDWTHVFLREEDAQEKLFDYLKRDFDKDSDNSCNVYYTIEEAQESLANQMGIDVDVLTHILRKKEIVDSKRLQKKVEAQERYKREKQERVDKWKEKFCSSKSGSDYDDADEWFNENKKEILEIVKNEFGKLHSMSSKFSKRIAWLIMKNESFDVAGLNSTSLSHVLRERFLKDEFS